MCGRVGGTDLLSGRILWNGSISVASRKMSLEDFLDNVEGPSPLASTSGCNGATDLVDCDDCNNCDEAGTQDNHTKLYGCSHCLGRGIRAISKSLLSCMGIFGSNAVHNC